MKNSLKAFQISGFAAIFTISMSAMAPAHADVIVDHSNGGRVDGAGWTNMGGNDWTVWDDFTLTSAATITEITYFSSRHAAISSPYTLQIGTAAGLSDVFSATIDSSAVEHVSDYSISVFNASFAPAKLSAGTYWLTFNNYQNIYGSASVSGGNLAQIGYGYAFTRNDYATSFILSGPANEVPEPASLALLGLGLGLGALTLRRRKN
jgi:hypothetical protein